MNELTAKSRILEEAGYTYNFDRTVYFNKEVMKVFSIEFVEDNDAGELQECLNDNLNGGEWRFYFNSPPSETVKDELVSVLDQ